MSHRLRRGLVFVAWGIALAAALPLLSRGEGPPRGDNYALLIGVRRYDPNELRDLPYAEADMTALAEVLKKAGYTRVVLLTQTGGADQPRLLPMAANIRTSLKGVLADLSPDDTVLVALAGHGVQYSGEDDNYFCPMDAKLADKTTLISLSDVYKELEKSAAGTRLLLADCCRNDPRSEEARAADKIKLESVTRPQKSLPPGGVAAYFSCSAGEKAYERADLGHGVFFHFVIEGLKGEAAADGGDVMLLGLSGWVTQKVGDYVRVEYAAAQKPELVGRSSGAVTLAHPDGAAPYMQKGVVLLQKHHYLEAVDQFTEAIRRSPRLVEAYVYRAYSYIHSALYDGAVADCTEAIRLDPRNANAWCDRGWAYLSKGQFDQAIFDCTEAIRLDPNNSDSWGNRGLGYKAKGQIDQAISDDNESIRLDPKNANAWYNRAAAYGRNEQWDQARRDVTEAIRLEPRNALFYRTRARYFPPSSNERAADLETARRLDGGQ